MSKYQFLRDSLHEIQAEASARGGHNPRSQLILDLLDERDMLKRQMHEFPQAFTANQRLERLTAKLGHLQVHIAVSLLSSSNPANHVRHDDYYVGLVAGHHLALEVLAEIREVIDPPPDAED